MSRAWLLLVWVACEAPERDWTAPPPRSAVLTLQMDPLVVGEPADVAVYGLARGQVVEIVRGDGGLGRGARLPTGETLPIRPGSGYHSEFQLRADRDGIASWTIPEVMSAPMDGWVVAVVRDGPRSAVSNPLYRPVRASPVVENDPLEPNDAVHTPSAIGAGVTSLRLCPGDEDWLSVVVPPREVASPLLVADRWAPPVHMTLHNAQGVPLPPFAYDNPWDVPIEILLQVHGTVSRCVEYDVSLEIGPPRVAPCNDDGVEPDDEQASAVIVPVGTEASRTSCSGDADWIRLEPGADGELLVELDGSVHGDVWDANGVLDVFDQDGTAVVAVTAGESVDIRVGSPRDTLRDGIPYTLRSTLRPECLETLGSQAAPVPLEAGVPFEVRLCQEGPDDGAVLALPVLPDVMVELEVLLDGPGGAVLVVTDDRGLPVDGEVLVDDDLRLVWRGPSHGYRPLHAHVRPRTAGRVGLGMEATVRHLDRRPCVPVPDESQDPTILTGRPWSGRVCPGREQTLTAWVPLNSVVDIDIAWETPPDGVVDLQRLPTGERLVHTEEQWVTVDLPAAPVGIDEGLAFTVQVDVADACEDAYEPNDNRTLARWLALDDRVVGRRCIDDDWYILPAEAGTRLHLLGACGEFFDGAGVPLTTGCASSVDVTTTGSVLLLLRGGAPPFDDYAFRVVAEPTSCVSDRHEPNDLFGDSALIDGVVTGVLCDGDADWFMAYADMGDPLQLAAISHGTGEPLVTLYPAGSATAQSTSLHTFRLGPGENQAVSYTAFPMWADGVCMPDGDGGVDASTATTVLQTADGRTCPGAPDWWTVSGAAGSVLRVDVDADETAFVDLQDPETGAMTRVDASAAIPLARGSQLVRVASHTGASYRLTVDPANRGALYQYPLPSTQQAEVEPNDDVSLAMPVTIPITIMGSLQPSDVDWYEVYLHQGERLHIGTNHRQILPGVTTTLYDERQRRQVRMVALSGAAMQHTASGTGAHFVEIVNPGNQTLDYDLDLVVEVLCVPDPHEPNDGISRATPLLAGQTLSGELCNGDLDTFRVPILAGQQLGIDLTAPGDNIEVTDPRGATVYPWTEGRYLVSASVDGDIVVDVSLDAVGRHERVPHPSPYTVEASVVDPCPPDPQEPDDHPQDATPLLDGPVVHGTLCRPATAEAGGDWYRVWLRPGETVQATLTLDADEGDADLVLYDVDGTMVAASGGVSAVESLQWTARRFGPMFLRANLWRDRGQGQEGVHYSIEATVH